MKSIGLTPDPPKPGEDLTVTAVGIAQERIEVGFTIVTCSPIDQVVFLQDGAYADVVVKLGLIKLLTKTFDVCEEA